MALTRGDKMIIIGAVALAATVVLGLAILKKPRLFSGGAAQQVAAIPPAPTAAAPVPAVQAPVGAVGQSSAPLPAAAPAPTGAPTPAPTPVAPTPTPTPAAPHAAASAPATASSTPAKPGPLPTVAGDETLEKMFAEIADDAPAKGKAAKPADKVPPQGPQAAPAPAVPEAAPAAAVPGQPGQAPTGTAADAPVAVDATAPPAEQPAPAPAPAKGKGKGKAAVQPAKTAEPAPAAKQAAKAEPKPAAQAKPAAKVEPAKAKATAVSGNVIRVIAEEKPGQYELVVQTTKPPASFTKMFLTDPPRLVLDIAGTWTYKGATTSDTGDAFIRHVRVGVHPDLFRVVLDMSPDAPAKLRGAPTVERVPEGVLLRIPK